MTEKEQRLYRVDRHIGIYKLFLPKFEQFHDACLKVGIRLLVVSGWRSMDEQFAIYKTGRELRDNVWVVVGPTLTNARPGASGHNVIVEKTREPAACCCDYIPLDNENKPLWRFPNEPADVYNFRWVSAYQAGELDTWKAIYKIAARAGLDAYGDPWGAYKPDDMGHFEEPNYKAVMKAHGLVFPDINMSSVSV